MELSRVRQKGITLLIMTEPRKVPEASFLYAKYEPLLLLLLLIIIFLVLGTFHFFSAR